MSHWPCSRNRASFSIADGLGPSRGCTTIDPVSETAIAVPFLDVGASYRECQAEVDAAVRRVLTSGWYIGGPEVSTFELQWANYCGVAHAVGLANGLDALHLALRAWDVGPGHEVIVPSNTYIATWLAITQCGATPVPVEPRPGTMNINPAGIVAAITSATRAIVPVHLYGQAAEMTPILAIAERYGLKVLEDAAQAHGARWLGRRVGSIAHAAAWSFYPGKNLGAFGDAGGVTSDDAAFADRIRVLRNYGSRKKYFNEVQGVNSRLDPLHAAALSVKLTHLDRWNARRGALARQYDAALKGVARLTLPVVADGAEPVWHLYVIQSDARDRLQAHLAASGVETLIHYPVPPHASDAYRRAHASVAAMPIADSLAARVLSLPIGPHLTDQQQAVVIDAIRSFRG
jgi:dTDP-4-amino-4,6-dideoxygalactose transaminase